MTKFPWGKSLRTKAFLSLCPPRYSEAIDKLHSVKQQYRSSLCSLASVVVHERMFDKVRTVPLAIFSEYLFKMIVRLNDNEVPEGLPIPNQSFRREP